MQEIAWAWLPWLYNRVNYLVNISNKFVRSINNTLYYENQWIFLVNKSTPIPKQLFNVSDINPIKIKWNASTNPPRFTATTFLTTPPEWKHISYLSFTVTLSDKSFHDLTDWINDVRWTGTVQPTPLEIFTLWCCETGSPHCFDLDSATVELVTDDGNVVKRGLNEFARTNIYEDGFSEDNRQDPNRIMDTVLSSSGR
jgi:hypothetical protein